MYVCNILEQVILDWNRVNSFAKNWLPTEFQNSRWANAHHAHPLEYQQNKFSLEFLSSLKSTHLHHIRSADFWLMSADLIWCKLGDFKEDKNSRVNLFC